MSAVEATSKEENLHGMFGIDVINIIQTEHPEWFNAECEATILQACEEAYESEAKIIDWIFEAGELDFLPAANIKEFIKHRFNILKQLLGFLSWNHSAASSLEQ